MNIFKQAMQQVADEYGMTYNEAKGKFYKQVFKCIRYFVYGFITAIIIVEILK